ncbi:MAG: hypothetical protein JXR52_05865 [Bacteroidales bacterium]|nr:hypothetical protein [Bacteroidales bacterium]MBN2698334.1 hypothetical protein [Bacteroidales bacterium]
MRTTFFRLLYLSLIIAAVTAPLKAQKFLQLNYQGILSAGDERIAQNPFNLNVKVLNQSGDRVLWKETFSLTTDSQGWFGFEINDFDRFFNPESNVSLLSVKMELAPSVSSTWKEGLSVAYSITRLFENDSVFFKISRMDESELTFLEYQDALFYRDMYPFIYLQGGFMLSLDETPDQLNSLRMSIEGDSAAAGEKVKSRGLKGGFAVGGYR